MSAPTPPRVAYLLLILSTFFWGGNFVLSRAVHADMPPLALAFWRWVLALVVILPFAWPQWKRHRLLMMQHWKVLLALSVLGITNFNTFVYIGLQTQPATNGLLLLSVGPIVILALSRLIFKESINVVQMLGMMISLLGVGVIVTQGQPGQLAQQFEHADGYGWILAAVVSWALYSVLLRLRPAGLPGIGLFGLTVLIGAIVLAPFYAYEHWVQQRHMALTTVNLLSIGYVGIFASILAFMFWNRGVADLGPARAGYVIHLIPVWGLLLATGFLGEQLMAYHWMGMCCIFGGIWLATVRGRARSGSRVLKSA